jgi:Carboxypeptidase regulatory-like domain
VANYDLSYRLPIVFLLASSAGAADYELVGRIVPQAEASVSLHGATKPFESATLSDPRGRFRFRKLAAGTYTLAVFDPERGEARQTVEVGSKNGGFKALGERHAALGCRKIRIERY